MRFDARMLVFVWCGGFVGSGILQSVFRDWFTSNTAWGLHEGLQTLLIIWNFGLAAVLAGVLRRGRGLEGAVVPGLVFLSLAFGASHVYWCLASSPAPVGNLIGAMAHGAVLILAVVCSVASRGNG